MTKTYNPILLNFSNLILIVQFASASQIEKAIPQSLSPLINIKVQQKIDP
jgi:hypothetical protein